MEVLLSGQLGAGRSVRRAARTRSAHPAHAPACGAPGRRTPSPSPQRSPAPTCGWKAVRIRWPALTAHTRSATTSAHPAPTCGWNVVMIHWLGSRSALALRDSMAATVVLRGQRQGTSGLAVSLSAATPVSLVLAPWAAGAPQATAVPPTAVLPSPVLRVQGGVHLVHAAGRCRWARSEAGGGRGERRRGGPAAAASAAPPTAAAPMPSSLHAPHTLRMAGARGPHM